MEVLLIGDDTQDSPQPDSQLWESARSQEGHDGSRSALLYYLQLFEDQPAQSISTCINFLNATMPSQRLTPNVAWLTNHLSEFVRNGKPFLDQTGPKRKEQKATWLLVEDMVRVERDGQESPLCPHVQPRSVIAEADPLPQIVVVDIEELLRLFPSLCVKLINLRRIASVLGPPSPVVLWRLQRPHLPSLFSPHHIARGICGREPKLAYARPIEPKRKRIMRPRSASSSTCLQKGGES